MNPQWKKWLIVAAIVAGGLVVAARFIDAHRNDQTKSDIRDAKVVHAGHVEQQKFQAHVDTVVDTLWRHEETKAAKAESIRAVSDTIGQFAGTLRDTANMWHLRWQLLGVAYDSLKSAKTDADARAVALGLGRDSARVDAARLDSLNIRLTHDLEHANDCHILPFVPCPSRKVAFVAGAATTGYLLIPPEKRKKMLAKILTFRW
ncbi:MAG: hypothetical protein JWL97_2983 [Gemmatimonadales bacterium]|nr:hypothetical protein [Gemmatimonadales bacterium]